MRKIYVFVPLAVSLLVGQAFATDTKVMTVPLILAPASKEIADAREIVAVPKDLEPELRQRMHGFFVNQQKINFLLESGEFKAASILAEIGHGSQEVAKFGPISAQKHWPDAMKKNSQAMRAATKAFVELSESSSDRQKVLAAYNRVIESCNSCHSTWQVRYTEK